MKNNNQAVVRKITSRALRSDKRRNFFIVAAIVLTAFMLTSVFSVGMSFYETLMITPLRTEGIRSHAAISAPSAEQFDTLCSLDYVKHIGVSYRVGIGYLDGFEQGMTIAAVGEESWRYFQVPVYTDIAGSVAKAENEIMLSRAHLSRMGVEEPYIGMEIPMEFETGGFLTGTLSEKQHEIFILSAIYTEYVSTMPNAYTPVFVSEAFAEKHSMLNLINTNVNLLFTNQNRAIEYAKRLASDLNLDYENEIAINPALMLQADMGLSTMYIAISIIITFFMLVGFLLIYNVMYISVSKDVRFYGLLKTMGTTPKQLRKIVNGQVFIMYILGFPIGLAAAALTSFMIVPSFISGSTGAVVSFSPVIFIGGAVFTLITAFLGASISARKAAKVSPVEAVRYTGEQSFSLKPRSSAKGKTSRMAWRNMFRERKRAFVVLLSLFLGITVFTGAFGIVNSMDIAGNIAYWYNHDIALSYVGTGVDDLGILGMDRGFIEEIAGIPGVNEVREQTLGIAMFEYPHEIREYAAGQGEFVNPVVALTGLDRAYMEELNEKLETPIDIEAFERGEIVLVDEQISFMALGGLLYEHFPVGTELYFELGQKSAIPVNAKIAGYAEIHNMTGWIIGMGGYLRLFASNSFLESVSGKAGTNILGINVEEGMDEPIIKAVSDMIEGRDVVMASVYEARQEQEEARFTMLVLGSTISGILALIGIFNFINLISVGILTRKREFAALESVGMTGKQMRSMLRWEGAIYWILTIASSITAGTGITYGLFNLVSKQNPAQFPQFIYPILPVVIVFCLIVLICTITPEICYRGISKMTLVERLREA